MTPIMRKRSPTPPAIPAMMAPKWLVLTELGLEAEVEADGEGVLVEYMVVV